MLRRFRLKDPILRDSFSRLLHSAPLLFPAVAFMIGSAFCSVMPGVWRSFWPVPAAFALLLTILLLYRYPSPLKPAPRTGILAAWFLAGITSATFHLSGDFSQLPTETAEYTAIIERAEENEFYQKLQLKLLSANDQHLHTPVKVNLLIESFDPLLETGSKISFRAHFKPYKVIKDFDDEVDPAEYALSKRIMASATLSTAEEVTVISNGNSVLNYFRKIGIAMRRIINDSPLSPLSRSYLCALLTGDRSALDPDSRTLFSAAGVAHLLALSGTHTGVIALMANLAFFPLLLFGRRRYRSVAVISLLWIYALSTGSQPSVVRAATMLSVFSGASLIMRGSSALNSLALSIIIILAINPSDMFDLGFQLSVASVISILLFGKHFNPIPYHIEWLRPIGQACSMTFSTTLGTSLITTLHFHFFPVYFLIGNLIVGLLIPFILGSGMLLLLWSKLSFSTGILCHIIDMLCVGADSTIHFIANLPGSTIDNIYFPAWSIVPWVIALILLRFFLTSRRPLYLTLFGVIIVAVIGWLYTDSRRIYPEEFAISRSSAAPELIVNHNDTLFIYSDTANDTLTSSRHINRYRHYAGRRDLKAITERSTNGRKVSSTSTTRAYERTTHRSHFFLPDGRSVALIGSSTRYADLPDSCNLLIIGRKHKLSSATILSKIHCDSIFFFSECEGEDLGSFFGRKAFDLSKSRYIQNLK